MTFGAISILVAHEKKFKAVAHPIFLRLYWVLNFVVIALFVVCAIMRLVSKGEVLHQNLKVDDIFFLVNLPISAFLFVDAIRRSSGISVLGESDRGSNSRTQLNIMCPVWWIQM